MQCSVNIDEIEIGEARQHAPLGGVPIGTGAASQFTNDSPSSVSCSTLCPCNHLTAWHFSLRGVEITAQYARVSRRHCERGKDSFEHADLDPSVAGTWWHVRIMDFEFISVAVDQNTKYTFRPRHRDVLRRGCGKRMATCGDLTVFPWAIWLKTGWSERKAISNVHKPAVDESGPEKRQSRSNNLLERDDIRLALQHGRDLSMCFGAPAVEIP